MKHFAISCDEAALAVPPEALFGEASVRERLAANLDPLLLAEWQALSERASEPNSFQEPWFVTAGLDHLAGQAEIRLIEVRRGALIGAIPLCVHRGLGRIPLANVRNWSHHNAFLGTPLVRKGEEREFWRALLIHLDASPWAPGLLHVDGLVDGGPVHAGLAAAAASLGRSAPVVQRKVRAALASDLSPQAYLETTVRKKKRKELKRLARRLAELGELRSLVLAPGEDWEPWCEAFLALERSGWKGRDGSALASAPKTERFFRQALAGARAAGRLQFRRLDLDGRPIAMLINFLAPPGSFSFKIAYDEAYARFSPGVLLQLDNLDLLSRPDIGWMDSCAAEDHPMIDSLWGERRSIVRISVRLAGFRRGLVFAGCRAAETGWAACKRALRRIK